MSSSPCSIFGHRLRERRDALGLAQESVGVAIGLEESSARARISRYELGVHEPPLATVKRLANALQVSVAYLYCEDEDVARLLLALHSMSPRKRKEKIQRFLSVLEERLKMEDETFRHSLQSKGLQKPKKAA